MALLVLPSVNKGHGWKRSTPNPNVIEFGDILHKGIKPTLAITGRVGFTDREDHPSIRDQLEFGSCTGQGPRTALQTIMRHRKMWLYAKKKQEPELSPRFAYYLGRLKEGSVMEDSGCEVGDVIDMLVEHGCALEKDCPYPTVANKTTWKTMTKEPSDAAKASGRWHQIKATRYKIRTIDQFLQALANKLPVVGGFTCLRHTFDRPDGVLLFPERGDLVEGGHCVSYLEADTNERMLDFPNSWSEDWGNKGYGRKEFRWFDEGYLTDCWAIDHE